MRGQCLLLLACVICLASCDTPRGESNDSISTLSVDMPVDAESTNGDTPADPADKAHLGRLDEAIERAPDDPNIPMRRAQALMKLKRYDEGYAAAREAMQRYIAAGDNLVWIMLESIETDRFRIDVHFNMGPKERQPPEIGIVRPLSFRVWKAGDEIQLIDAIDFEYGYFDNAPSTATFGKSTRGRHENYGGNVSPQSSYSEIRSEAVALIRRMHGD